MLVTASFAGFFVSPFFLVFHFTIYFLDFDSGECGLQGIVAVYLSLANPQPSTFCSNHTGKPGSAGMVACIAYSTADYNRKILQPLAAP